MQHTRNPHQDIADRVMRELDDRAPVIVRYTYSRIVVIGPWITLGFPVVMCFLGAAFSDALGFLLMFLWGSWLIFVLTYAGFYIRDQRRNVARKRAVEEALRYAADHTD